MKIIAPKGQKINANPILSSSKSESNRALIIQSISNNQINLNNLSFSEDTQILKTALSELNTKNHFNCNNAGTTFRFLSTYLSTIKGEWIMDGSLRMQKRPVDKLIQALIELGANIEFLKNNGFAPIKIIGTELKGDYVEINGDISSQFISALLLIAPSLTKGLKINIKGPIYSKSYIELTLQVMKYFGVDHTWKGSLIEVPNQKYKASSYTIENDWSAASYWFSIAALSDECKIHINGLKEKSNQGDSIIMEYYKQFGVQSEFINNELIIKKTNNPIETSISLNLNDYPDIAQTIAVTCVGLGVKCHLSGLETLQFKETNRLEAIKNELNKLGIYSSIENKCINIPSTQQLKPSNKPISTYGDHRMAMAFAPLSLKTNELNIDNPLVVKKSYPEFWNDLSNAGFIIQK